MSERLTRAIWNDNGSVRAYFKGDLNALFPNHESYEKAFKRNFDGAPTVFLKKAVITQDKVSWWRGKDEDPDADIYAELNQ